MIWIREAIGLDGKLQYQITVKCPDGTLVPMAFPSEEDLYGYVENMPEGYEIVT